MTPDSFDSLEHYCVSLVYPLLEKTRAHLCSSMKDLCTTPFADLVSVKPSGELFYDASVDNWGKTASGRGNYKTLPGDILLLTHVNPQIVYNLESLGTSWTFGSVQQISEDKCGDGNGNSSNHFQLKMFNYKEEQKYQFVVFLMNITAGRNIWDAMRARRGNILKVALRLDSMVSKEVGFDRSLFNRSLFPRLSILGHSKDLFDAIGDLLDENSDLFKNPKWKILFSHNFRKLFEEVRSLEVKLANLQAEGNFLAENGGGGNVTGGERWRRMLENDGGRCWWMLEKQENTVIHMQCHA